MSTYLEKLIIILISIISLFNCQKKINKSIQKRFSEVFVPVDTLRLETNKDCIIPIAMKVKNWNKKWYVSSITKIFLFDENGNFIKKFGQKGEGPGEFNLIKQFDFKKSGNILILDSVLGRITVLDSTLNYIKMITGITGNFESFLPIKGKYFFYNRNLFSDNKTIFVYGPSFNFTRSIVPFPYNSVVQIYWAGNINMVFAEDLDKLIVTHLFDPILKIVDLNNWDNIDQIPLNFPYWIEVKENEIKKTFPRIDAPSNLYKFLKDKTVLWEMYYLNNGLLLIMYQKRKEKIQYFQIFNIKQQKTLAITELPEKNLWIKGVEGLNAYFIRTFYESDNITNPHIIKFKINLY